MPENDAPECLCGIMLREDRDMCLAHGTAAQQAQAVLRVSVGRTQPLWEWPN
jgi:hypothetical protein